MPYTEGVPLRQNDRIKMKKKDRKIKKYLAVLTVDLCAFALFAGVSDSVYTEKQILESVAQEAKNGREFLNAIDEKITEMIFG